GVAPDESGRAVQDLLERSAVVRQRQPLAAEATADVLDLRIAPAVNGLLGIADHGNVSEILSREQADEVELYAVGVLELVDEEVREPLTATPAEFRHALERVDYIEDEVVEIAQPFGRQRLLVCAVHKVQHLDRLELGGRRLPRGGIDRRVPVLRMQLKGTLVEALGRDAPALQLEQEAQPRAKQLVEVVDAEGGERIRVEGS